MTITAEYVEVGEIDGLELRYSKIFADIQRDVLWRVSSTDD